MTAEEFVHRVIGVGIGTLAPDEPNKFPYKSQDVARWTVRELRKAGGKAEVRYDNRDRLWIVELKEWPDA